MSVQMPMSTDGLSTLSDADVLDLRLQVRNLGRTLRNSLAGLVERRMAREISFEEYTTGRRALKDQRAECEGKGEALSAEIRRRGIWGM